MDWYAAQGRAVHARWFAATAALALLVSLAFGAPTLTVQLIALTGPVAVLGLPHGALDYPLGRALFAPHWGRWWPAVFVPAYLLVALLVIMVWYYAPGLSLGLFLLITIWHFGVSDAGFGLPQGAWQWLEVIARGGLVITLPAAFYPDDVALLFGYLAPPAVAETLTATAAGSAPVLIGVALLVAGNPAYVWLTPTRPGHQAGRTTILELLTLILLFLWIPPLLAFGLYFCLLHALRHVLSQASLRYPANPRQGLCWAWRQSLPVTAVTLLLAGVAYNHLDAVDLPQRLTQMIFIGLAALTWPHILLAVISARIKPAF